MRFSIAFWFGIFISAVASIWIGWLVGPVSGVPIFLLFLGAGIVGYEL